MSDYYKGANDIDLDELKSNKGYQRDLVKFFKERYKWTEEDFREKGLDQVHEDFVEHMRYQTVNEGTALKDLFFVKDQETSDEAKASFGRLMSAWDKVDDGGGSRLTKAGDYLAGIATSPSFAAGLLAGGVGGPISKLGAQAGSKGIQIGVRHLASQALTKAAAATASRAGISTAVGKAATAVAPRAVANAAVRITPLAAKESLKKAAVKGAVRGAAVEGAIGYGHQSALEESRDTVSPDYEYDPGRFWLAVGSQSAMGGVTGGLARTLTVKQQNKAVDQLERIHQAKIANEAKFRTKAVNAISGANPALRDQIGESLEDLVRVYDQAGSSKIKFNPLDPEDVARGEDLLSTVSNPASDGIRNGLSISTLRKVFAAGVDLANDGKIQMQKGERITQALARAMGDDSQGTSAAFREIADKYGLSSDEMGYLVMADMSHAGKMLNLGSQLKGRMDTIANDYADLARAGLMSVNDDVLRNYRRSAGKGSSNPAVEALRQVDMLRVGMMTAQPATTAANVVSSGARTVVDISDRLWENVLVRRQNPIKGTLSVLKGATFSRKDADLMFAILGKEAPEQSKILFKAAARVELETAGTSPIAKFVRGMNTLNTVTDLVFKRAAFYGSIERQLMDLNDPAIGRNVSEFLEIGTRRLEGGDDVSIFGRLKTVKGKDGQDIFHKAKEDALSLTFQRGYEGDETAYGKGANAVIRAAKDYPFTVTSFVPFPRYVANQIEFIHDYTPGLPIITGRFLKSNAGHRSKLTPERWAKQATGVMLATSAYYLRAGQEGKTQPLDFISDPSRDTALESLTPNDRNIRELGRVGGPFNTHLVIMDAVYRKMNDMAPPKAGTLVMDALETATGMGFAGYSQGLIGDIRDSVNQGGWTDASEKTIGDFFSTFTLPAAVADDIVGQLDPERAARPYTRELKMSPDDETNLLGEAALHSQIAMRALRFLPDLETTQYLQSFDGETDVPLYSPFQSDPVRVLNPALKHLSGINTKTAPTQIQKDINSVGLKEWRLYSSRKVENPVLDVIVRRQLAQTLPQEWELVKEEINWDAGTTEVKQEALTQFVNDKVLQAEAGANNMLMTLMNDKPRLVAGFVRNMYALETKAAKLPVDDAAMKFGGVASADEYIGDSESIPEEIARRLQVLQWSNQYDEGMDIYRDN